MALVLSLPNIPQVDLLALRDNRGLLVDQGNPALQDHQKSPDPQNQAEKAVGQPIAMNRFFQSMSDVPNKARHGDVYYIEASPPFRSRACWRR